MARSKDIPDDLWTLPRTRAEAKAIGSRYYFTGERCTRGHMAARITHNHTCRACENERGRNIFASKAPEREAARAERESRRAAQRQRDDDMASLGFDPRGGHEAGARLDRIEQIGLDAVLAEDEEKRRAEAEKAKQARLDRMAEEGTENVRGEERANYRKNYWRDPEKQRARIRERRRRGVTGYRMIRLRTPPWLTTGELEEIEAVYATRTGPMDHVDHIVPIDDHPDIAGLHVPWNLQVLHRARNAQRTRGRTREFRCTAEETAEYVARGMAVWKKDIEPDGHIPWWKYPPPS